MQKTIIVMPVANEEATMENIITQIMSLPYDNLFLYPVIDSYSADRTEQIIRQAENTYNSRVKCIFHSTSTGVISCYLYGFKKALEDGAERIIEMDGGGSHHPEELPQFIRYLDEGYDCVFGSRFMPGGDIDHLPLYRRVLSSGGTWLSNLVLGTHLSDMTSGFEAFQRPVLEHMDLDAFLSQGHIYQTEMRYYCRHLHYIEVPIHYTGSASSLKFKSISEAFSVLFRLKQHEPRVMQDQA